MLDQTSHRPWPMPRTPWVLYMRWHDLLFLHWPIRPEVLRPLVPRALELDTFDGWCWLGVVPFRMSGVQPRWIPIPLAFPELNVRTYVTTRGRPGVWFFSLDASSRLAVRAARVLGMPYYGAQMSLRLRGETVEYESARTHRGAPSAEFAAEYAPAGAVFQAIPGTLDHWLTERYRLYAALRPGRIVYGDIHHAAWALQPAKTEVSRNTMAGQIGVALPRKEPICHFARFQEVVAWPILPLKIEG